MYKIIIYTLRVIYAYTTFNLYNVYLFWSTGIINNASQLCEVRTTPAVFGRKSRKHFWHRASKQIRLSSGAIKKSIWQTKVYSAHTSLEWRFTRQFTKVSSVNAVANTRSRRRSQVPRVKIIWRFQAPCGLVQYASCLERYFYIILTIILLLLFV